MKYTDKDNLEVVVLALALICLFILKVAEVYLGNANSRLICLSRVPIFLFFLAFWSACVYLRMVVGSIRSILVKISLLMIFWYLVRSYKFFFATSLTQIKYLWYIYYIPMLLIPVLCLDLAFRIGKRFDKPSFPILIAYGVSLVCIVLVLTNDIHGWVFGIDPNATVPDDDFVQMPIYFLIMFWELSLAFVSYMVLFYKLRAPLGQRRGLLPFIPLICLILYVSAYALDSSVLSPYMPDLTVSNILIIITILETAMAEGLIQTNRGYTQLFSKSDLCACICDENLEIVLASEGYHQRTPVNLDLLSDHSSYIRQGIRTCKSPLDKGYVIWQEDIRAINDLIANLEEAKLELEEETDVAWEKYCLDKKKAKIQELNKIFDSISKATQRQINSLMYWIEVYKAADNKGRRRALENMVVIGAYLKRRNNLMFLGYANTFVPVSELGLCFSESISALTMKNVAASYLCHLDGDISCNKAGLLYEFFQDVVELTLDEAQAYLIVLTKNNDSYVLRIAIDTIVDFALLTQLYGSEVFVEVDENEMIITFGVEM